ncbi:hypothetical protein [Corynebacterium callunae]|uniref:Uncharacterized protein n=1 Tax=Corynebacterium callunae DSM 20147 TaxID=1121353 RepID=M1TTT8_9CORY|nr:hypothetical protein [Corynebacterium callunae]AGG67636.1 hypothetical protein H924_11040 [Corynebacterium callunae DSM 20147]
MSIYPPNAATEFTTTERHDGTLSDYLQSAIGKALKEFIGDDRLAYMAMADDLVPATLKAFTALDFNHYERDEATHTPQDSLVFLNHEVVGLLEAADEEIHGVSTETALNTDELPEHLQNGIAMIHTAQNLIRLEVGVHGLAGRAKYSNGTPVREHYQKPGTEPQDDGTTALVIHDYVTTLYPDGFRRHPAFRTED